MNQISTICVFCGSNPGVRPIYQETAQRLGKELVHREINLVYGGGDLGMMGTIARTVYQEGGKVTGVIPETLAKHEIIKESYGELITVQTMHERKATMARLSDAFIAMPGGFGTLEELFEVITWGQLGIHSKPIGLLNIDGYFNTLIQFIESTINNGFIRPHHRTLFFAEKEPIALLDKLTIHQPPSGLLKWMDLDQT